MANSENKGFVRLVDATRFSMLGFVAAWRNEEAFRIECVVTVLLLPVAIWLGQNMIEIAILVASLLLVLLTELLNSAIENLVDRVSHELHELSGRAKDMGSAAVFVSLVIAAISWGAVAWQRFAT